MNILRLYSQRLLRKPITLLLTLVSPLVFVQAIVMQYEAATNVTVEVAVADPALRTFVQGRLAAAEVSTTEVAPDAAAADQPRITIIATPEELVADPQSSVGQVSYRATSADQVLLGVRLDGLLDTISYFAIIDDSTAVVQLLIAVACIVLCWHTYFGLWLSAAALVLSLIYPSHGQNLNLLLMLPIVLIPLWRWRQIVALGAGLSVYILADAIRLNRRLLDRDTYLLYVVVAAGTVIGLTARWFLHQHDIGQTRIDELEEENQRIRTDERTALARELHDVVAHQLSITSLQVMGHGQSDDPAELRAAMRRIDDATRAALSELRLIVGVLRDDTVGIEDTAALREQTVPSAMAASLQQLLAENGFGCEMTISPDVDQLNLSAQRTVSRVLQEATTNILRNTPDGGHCRYQVETSKNKIRVVVSSPMPASGAPKRLAGQSLGYGLRGVRERIDLTGGTMSAGPVGSDWVLEVNLPRVGDD